MKTFIPINGHIEIEPLTQEGFVVEQNAHYEEKGRIIEVADDPKIDPKLVGCIAYFDSWLAKKYATGENDAQGQPKYRWLVKFEDVSAIEYVTPLSK